MKEVIILMGIGKCGKTTYAKSLKGHKYIGLDKNFAYGKGIKPWYTFVNYFVNTLNSDSSSNFVLDGWINACTDSKTGARVYTGHGFEEIQKRLKHHTIHPIVVIQDKNTLRKRGIRETDERIAWLYAWWLTMRGVKDIILGSGNNKAVPDRDAAMTKVLCKDSLISPAKIGSKIILRKLKRRKIERAPHHGDPYYQTIELAEGITVKGYNSAYEHKTWNIIKSHLDVVGKDVGEVGCHHGFYLLNIKGKGANKVIGYDYNPYTVESASQIAHFRELNVNYELLDIEKQELPSSFDIILVMNTFHHLKNVRSALAKVFSKARECVFFESQLNIHMLTEVGSQYGFSLTKQLQSVRPHRTIWIFTRNKK